MNGLCVLPKPVIRRVFSSVAAVGAVWVLCVAMANRSPAQTLTTLTSFNATNGAEPNTVLVQGTDGNFYGLTGAGGLYSFGTVFQMTPAGSLTTLYNFCSQPGCTDGANAPLLVGGALAQGADGNFYGTTPLGGVNTNCNQPGQTCGTAFKITPDGTFTPLHSFSAADGSFPNQLALATDGNFYGTTQESGAHGGGTVFRMTPTGMVTPIYHFCSQPGCPDGAGPIGALVQANNGNFYGTTFGGGALGFGTIFKITTKGKLTTLVPIGGSPSSTLVQSTDGNFYGTAARDGSVFKMTPSGKLTTLGTVGGYPYAGLMQGTDGSLYGTTYQGGPLTFGTAYRITRKGVITSVYTFCSQPNCTDGFAPLAGLIQGTDGNLYGGTIAGGACSSVPNCYGTIFSLGVGLHPFVETRPTSGRVGSPVTILGNNLTGAASVTFNGLAATFTVVASTEIMATVPSGASTGKVRVTTPGDTLISNTNFHVKR